MFIAFSVNGLNIVLDYILIYGQFGLPAMGLRGAAIASLVSQVIGGAICLKLLFFSSYTAPYDLARWRIHIGRLLPLFRIGRDIAIRTGALRFSMIFATAMISRMGAGLLSSHEIAIQLWLLCSDTIDGLAVAGQALVAKRLGSNHRKQAYRLGKALILWGLSAGLIFALCYNVLQDVLIALFTRSPEVIRTLSGGRIFLLLALSQPINGIVFVLDGFLIGAHDTRFLMWAMLIGSLGIFVPISWISLRWELGLLGIWAGLTLLMAYRLITNLYRLFSRRWLLVFPHKLLSPPTC